MRRFPLYAKIKCPRCQNKMLEIVPFVDKDFVIPVLVCNDCDDFFTVEECDLTMEEFEERYRDGCKCISH